MMCCSLIFFWQPISLMLMLYLLQTVMTVFLCSLLEYIFQLVWVVIHSPLFTHFYTISLEVMLSFSKLKFTFPCWIVEWGIVSNKDLDVLYYQCHFIVVLKRDVSFYVEVLAFLYNAILEWLNRNLYYLNWCRMLCNHGSNYHIM